MLGTATYRSAAEWRERFGRAPVAPEWRRSGQFAPEFAVQSYMEAQADKFVHTFDANCYLYLSRAMDRFDLSVHGLDALSNAGLEAALIIGVETDLLFPLAEQRALASMFESAGVATTFAPLQCLEGHDSFLVDIAQFGERIRNFLASPLPGTRSRV
jgi:homoserine O-acetyltransferase